MLKLWNDRNSWIQFTQTLVMLITVSIVYFKDCMYSLTALFSCFSRTPIIESTLSSIWPVSFTNWNRMNKAYIWGEFCSCSLIACDSPMFIRSEDQYHQITSVRARSYTVRCGQLSLHAISSMVWPILIKFGKVAWVLVMGGAHWRYLANRFNDPCAAIRPYVKLLWPLFITVSM